jgi:hypothetical protein
MVSNNASVGTIDQASVSSYRLCHGNGKTELLTWWRERVTPGGAAAVWEALADLNYSARHGVEQWQLVVVVRTSRRKV